MNSSQSDRPPVLIVTMGVSGTGKSTLGISLARSLGFAFIDGDDLHPPENIRKMSEGIPLGDGDREPWLERIRRTAEGRAGEGVGGVVVGCSALKRYYRDMLRGKGANSPTMREEEMMVVLPTYFVFIKGERALLLDRMSTRQGHFMKAAMLDSQLEALESPEETGEEGVVVVNAEDGTEVQVHMAMEGLQRLGVVP